MFSVSLSSEHLLILFSIFAIGDCIEGPMLAHKAEDEGNATLYFLNFVQDSSIVCFTYKAISI